jgi:hypothetical protein
MVALQFVHLLRVDAAEGHRRRPGTARLGEPSGEGARLDVEQQIPP